MTKTKTIKHFDALAPTQRKAATYGTPADGKGVVAGPLMILAGAGTGKTVTLAHRVAHLVLNGVDPARILLLTFSRRATLDIIQRAQTIVTDTMEDRGKLGDRSVVSRLIWSGTFHSVGSRILRLFSKHLSLDPTFTLIDRSEAADMMDAIRIELGIGGKDKRFPRKEACLAIYSCRVNSRLPLKQTIEEQFPYARECEQDLTRVYREYVARKQKNNILDPDDVLLYWHMMMQNPALAQGLAKNFDHIVIDDYQDTSTLQVEIVHALKPDGAGVTVAGDDAQAIYPFRAPPAQNLPGFAKRFAGNPAVKVEIVGLVQNYRSSQRILDCAAALLADGPREYRRSLLTTRQGTHKPVNASMEDATVQAEYIVGKLLATREIGGSLQRHTVLFRSPQHSEALEAELGKRGIPYIKHGSFKYLEGEHIRDALAILRWADNPRNLIAAARVLKLVPEVTPAQAQQAIALAETNNAGIKALASLEVPQSTRMIWKNFCALMEKLADSSTQWAGQVTLVRQWYKPQIERLYEASWGRIADIERLEHMAVHYPSRERFLTDMILDPPAAAGNQSSQAGKDEDHVILSSIQAAKGLEWDIVYVLNVTEGNFPSQGGAASTAILEEERRLLYVAITRARNELHLCTPLKLSAAEQGGRSRFMNERVQETVESINYRSLRSAENLRAGDASVDVAAQLKDMW